MSPHEQHRLCALALRGHQYGGVGVRAHAPNEHEKPLYPYKTHGEARGPIRVRHGTTRAAAPRARAETETTRERPGRGRGRIYLQMSFRATRVFARHRVHAPPAPACARHPSTMKTTTYAAAGWRDARQHTRHARTPRVRHIHGRHRYTPPRAQPEGGSSTWVQIARHRSSARTDQQPAKLQCKTAPAALSQGATTITTPPMLRPGPTGEEYRACGPRPPPRSTRWKQRGW